MATNQLRDAEILAQQLGITLVNTTVLTAPSDSSIPKDSDTSYQNQLDDTGREIQLEIILQKALLSVLKGQRLSGVQQLSDGLIIAQQNQWPGMEKFTVIYLLALAEIYMVRTLRDWRKLVIVEDWFAACTNVCSQTH